MRGRGAILPESLTAVVRVLEDRPQPEARLCVTAATVKVISPEIAPNGRETGEPAARPPVTSTTIFFACWSSTLTPVRSGRCWWGRPSAGLGGFRGKLEHCEAQRVGTQREMGKTKQRREGSRSGKSSHPSNWGDDAGGVVFRSARTFKKCFSYGFLSSASHFGGGLDNPGRDDD